MKFIKTFKYISENINNDNKKYLYHIIDKSKLNYIIDNDIITSYIAGDGKISTTRDISLNGYIGDNTTTLFKLVIDWDKLSKDYDTKPFVYRSQTGLNFNYEEEEQIQTNRIENIWQYVICVVLIKDRVDKLKKNPFNDEPTDWFTTIGGNGGNLPNIIKVFKEKLINKNIPFYTQNGNIIEEDTKYIDSIINYPITQVDVNWIIVYKGNIVNKREFWYDEIYVDNGGSIINIEWGSVVDTRKFDLIEFSNIKSVKNQLKNFTELKQFDNHKLSEHEKGFIPHLVKLENRNDKWVVSDDLTVESMIYRINKYAL